MLVPKAASELALLIAKSCSQDLYFLLCGVERLVVQQVYHSHGFRLTSLLFGPG